MRNYITEAIGTFLFVFTIGMTVVEPGAGVLTPIAIGLTLAIMVYAGGHISGGHYNPAVTFAVMLRGKLSPLQVVPYWISQVSGAVLAGATCLSLKPGSTVAPLVPAVGPAFLVETIFTFALAYVVLNVATAPKNQGNSFYGFAIGATVICGAIAVGSISGGAFNPAVAIGLCAVGVISWSSLWIYIAANLLGGAIAAGVYTICADRDDELSLTSNDIDEAPRNTWDQPRGRAANE